MKEQNYCGNCKYKEELNETCCECMEQMLQTKDRNYPLWESPEVNSDIGN